MAYHPEETVAVGYFHWRTRYSILAVSCCAYLLCYMDRMAIAIALPFIAKDLGLSSFEMGAALSAFFVGYSVMQIPGGLLVDKFGPRRVVTVAIAGWSLFTALTATATSLTSLLAIRALFGVMEGPYPPAASKAVVAWFPARAVGRANAIQLASVNVGAAVAPLIVAPLIAAWGWRPMFLSLFFPGMLLALMAWLGVRDRPAAAPADSMTGAAAGKRLAFKDCLRMPVVVWCAISLFFGNMAGWGLMNWLPTYLLHERQFGISKTGFLSALPFLAGALGYFVGGQLSDRYFNTRRYVPIAIGFLLSSVMTYAAAIAPSGEWAVAALVIVFLGLFAALGGIFTLPLVVAPAENVGTVFGIVNTFGQVAAFLSPLLIGYMLDVTSNNFVMIFYLLMGLFIVATCSAMKIGPLTPETPESA